MHNIALVQNGDFMRRWKKIEGRGGTKQILRIWRHNPNEKIEFDDLLQQIDKEFRLVFSRRTKINYVNELVDEKLLGRERKGRRTFYWPLQLEEAVRACLIELISSTPRDFLLPSGFLTFFGLDRKVLTTKEKQKLIEIKDEFENVFRKLMTFKFEVWLRRLESEWNNVIENKEIHVIIKWMLWYAHTYFLISQSGLKEVPDNEGHIGQGMVCSSIAKICEQNGVKIPSEKRRLLIRKVGEIYGKNENKLEKLSNAFVEVYRDEGARPLALIGATPIMTTPLGQHVFRLKHALEKDLVETVLPKTDENKRQMYKAKLDEKIATLSEKEKKAERQVKTMALIDVLSTKELEHDVCNWVKSEIL